ncbi:MAG: hypothetical protein AB8C13_07910 [Phycisphaerales bacterium]
MAPVATILGVILGILAAAFVLAGVVFLFSTIFALTMRVLKNIFTFIGATVTDFLRLVGSILAAIMFAPLTVLAIVFGRWSRSKHFATAFSMEWHSAFRSIYRIFIGNPARLLGLSSALEGVEKRVPDAMAAAPTRDKPSKKRVGVFDGYTIVGSLKGGGSGGKLYIAEPDEIKQAAFVKRGMDVGQVVIKVFSLKDGSSMPQIVRESRALDAARKLGLVLEHELTGERFFYVMRYVPGESLTAVTQRMHSLSPREGLDDTQLKHTIGYADDLLVVLDSYHRSGLWHKDVKPDNIIIDGKHGDAKAHLVDFGLVTPLRSAMTLTTHGTEYFRDPELVRQALRGVKVHQIDGSKFDVYAAGAVLYSMIENSFPAHSGLSQISKRCPDALRWIVRRAMAEYDRRYPSANAMLADLRVVMTAEDQFSVKPADLPSVKLGDDIEHEVIPEPMPAYGPAPTPRAGSPVPPAAAFTPNQSAPNQSAPNQEDADQRRASGSTQRVGRPSVNLVDWWSGKYAIAGKPAPKQKKQGKKKGFVVSAGLGEDGAFARVDRPQPLNKIVPADQRKSAKDQLKHARGRAQKMRGRAQSRRAAARKNSRSYNNAPGAGVIFAGLLGIGVLFAGVVVVGALIGEGAESRHAHPHPPEAPDTSYASAYASAKAQHGDHQHTDDFSFFSQSRYPDSPSHFYSSMDLPLVDVNALFVSHNANSIDSELRTEISNGLRILDAHGMETYGDFAENATERDIELLAEYRNAIGAVPGDSDELIIRSRDWINSHEDSDAVMILTTDPDDGQFRVILVTSIFHTNQPVTETTVKNLLLLLKNNGYGAHAD